MFQQQLSLTNWRVKRWRASKSWKHKKKEAEKEAEQRTFPHCRDSVAPNEYAYHIGKMMSQKWVK